MKLAGIAVVVTGCALAFSGCSSDGGSSATSTVTVTADASAPPAAPTTAADPQDKQFLAHLHEAHITAPGGDDELLALGKMTCQKLIKGYDYKLIGVALTEGGDMKRFQAGGLIMAAAMDLCPQFADRVHQEMERDLNR